MENFSLILAIVVVTALAFDFTNGFHDTANAMATTISTGALKPKVAVAMSAALNLVGAFLSVEVANTISKGLVDETGIRPRAFHRDFRARVTRKAAHVQFVDDRFGIRTTKRAISFPVQHGTRPWLPPSTATP